MEFFQERQHKLKNMVARLRVMAFSAFLGAILLAAPSYLVDGRLLPFFAASAGYLLLFLIVWWRQHDSQKLLPEVVEIGGEFGLLTFLIFLTEGHLSPFEIVYLSPVLVATLRLGKKAGLLTGAAASLALLLFHIGVLNQNWQGNHLLTELVLIVIMGTMAWFVGEVVDWEKSTVRENMRLQREINRQAQLAATVAERQRLARELHDGLTQDLAYLCLESNLLRQSLARGEQAAAQEVAGRLAEGLGRAYREVRQSISDLRPTAFSGEDFLTATRQYLADLGRRYGMDVCCTGSPGNGKIHLPPAVEIHLMRILQEALANVRKHAATAKAEVILRQEGTTLMLAVRDNGCGFNVAAARQAAGGYGLVSMAERAKLAGGTLEIASTPGSGTAIVVKVALPESNPPAKEVRHGQNQGGHC